MKGAYRSWELCFCWLKLNKVVTFGIQEAFIKITSFLLCAFFRFDICLILSPSCGLNRILCVTAVGINSVSPGSREVRTATFGNYQVPSWNERSVQKLRTMFLLIQIQESCDRPFLLSCFMKVLLLVRFCCFSFASHSSLEDFAPPPRHCYFQIGHSFFICCFEQVLAFASNLFRYMYEGSEWLHSARVCSRPYSSYYRLLGLCLIFQPSACFLSRRIYWVYSFWWRISSNIVFLQRLSHCMCFDICLIVAFLFRFFCILKPLQIYVWRVCMIALCKSLRLTPLHHHTDFSFFVCFAFCLPVHSAFFLWRSSSSIGSCKVESMVLFC
jgi:hypothetical protein